MRSLRAIRLGLAALLLGGAVHAASPPSPDDAALIAAGKQLYRTGIAVSGEPLRAAIRSDVRMEASDLACVRCHRRSGLGSSEGGVGIPPIAGATLFTAQTASLVRDYRHGELSNISRPAYTLETLAATLHSGVTPAGRVLSPLMPRYDIADADVAALAAYLPTLVTSGAAGITAEEIHFATIIAPDTDRATHEAMLDVMRAYVAGKNAGTRGETRRAERAPFHREWMYSAYRKWVLHEWRLSGPPQQWRKQLEAYYRGQPVFAVLGGLGRGQWQPVHAFCEERELPCLFPHLEAPPGHAERDFYSFYFSRGLLLEAQALAAYLNRNGRPASVLQVLRGSPERQAAAAALAEGLGTAGDTHLIAPGEVPDAAYWQRLLRDKPAETLVLWLEAADLGGLAAAAAATPQPKGIFLSSTLLPEPAVLTGQGLGGRLHLLHPFQLPGDARRQARFRLWAAQQGIELHKLRAQSDAYFAVTLAGEALMHIRGNLSREYFIERIEHMTDSMIYTSTYPRLALAPGQRYAAKGAYVWRPEEGTQAVEWVVP